MNEINNYNYNEQLQKLLKFEIGSGSVLSAKEFKGQIFFEEVSSMGRLWRGIGSIMGLVPAEELEHIKIFNVAQKIATFVNNMNKQSLTIQELKKLKEKIEKLKGRCVDETECGKLAQLVFSGTLNTLNENIRRAERAQTIEKTKYFLSKMSNDSSEINTYKIRNNNKIEEGNVYVENKTKQTVTVIVKRPIEDFTYHVIINERKLINPITNRPFFYMESEQIKLEPKDHFIQITEKNGQTGDIDIRYVDTKKEIKLKEESAYKIYSYMPREINETTAMQKIQDIVNNPNMTDQKVVYNRHGVAIYGKEAGQPVLYWANPDEEKVKQRKIHVKQGREEDSIIVQSVEIDVSFEHQIQEKDSSGKQNDFYLLNGEPALVLEIQESKQKATQLSQKLTTTLNNLPEIKGQPLTRSKALLLNLASALELFGRTGNINEVLLNPATIPLGKLKIKIREIFQEALKTPEDSQTVFVDLTDALKELRENEKKSGNKQEVPTIADEIIEFLTDLNKIILL